MPIKCDPANCPTGKRVDEALNAIGGLRQDLGHTRQDYKDTQRAFSETHDALIEQTATLGNVVQNMDRDREERKETEEKLFSKVNANTVTIESKADKDKVVTKSGATILISILALVFTILGFFAVLG